jgi:hypothetical protein
MLEDDSALPDGQSEADLIKDLAGVAYLAGSDTTVAAVLSFFLAMLVYPNVQAKGQAEIDRVVGRDRLPELEDAENMPYVQAIASECLRWLPVVPLGSLSNSSTLYLYAHKASRIALPHATSRDDEYKGYLIPKGTIVMGSVWSVLKFPVTRSLRTEAIAGPFCITPRITLSPKHSGPRGTSRQRESLTRLYAIRVRHALALDAGSALDDTSPTRASSR